ncbi:unnamed protein product [Rotaria socialis]|nr:unnamed protein product [Rotaria socialis]
MYLQETNQSLMLIHLVVILFSIFRINVVAVPTNSNSVTSGTPVIMNDTSRHLLGRKSSLATAIVNSQVLTVFSYQGNQIYVYHALSNENDNAQTPQKWIFYFVPIMLPFQTDNTNDEWIFAVNSEIRVKLMLSNPDVEEMARRAIIKKYPLSVAQYSNY